MAGKSWQDVEAGWDGCRLRSEVGGTAYQEGSVVELMTPDAILAFVRERVGNDLEGSAIYCGTLPLIGGEFRCEPRFTAALSDPQRARELRCSYTVEAVDDID